MALERAGSGMIAGDGQHVGPLLEQDREGGVEILDGFFLRREIAVFAVHVGVFVMDEEIVVVVVFGEVALELFGDGLRAFDFGHADELRQALVHGIDGEAGGFEPVALLEKGNGGLMGDAAQEESVGGMFSRR